MDPLPCYAFPDEGGGLYRDSFLVAASRVRVAENGINATATPDVEIFNNGNTPVTVTAQFTLRTLPGLTTVSVVDGLPTTIPAQSTAVVTGAQRLDLSNVTQWSIQNPVMYTLEAALSVDGSVVDSATVSTGFRTATFTADSGFHLNGKRVILRGFSDHNSLAGVGVAIPQRLNLFRANMLRGIGMNIWRMSHNPGTLQHSYLLAAFRAQIDSITHSSHGFVFPVVVVPVTGDPAMFDMLDALGVLSWDENRWAMAAFLFR